MVKFYPKIWVVMILIGILFGIQGPGIPAHAQSPSYLHTEGSHLVDANGNPVILTGLNWFGLETEAYAPHGLWARSLDSIMDQIVELGFNTIRLPYSNQLFDPGSTPNSINYDLNPDLEGLSGLEIMDKVIAEAGERGLKVILDRHRPDSHAQSELWYTAQYGEERWIGDWTMLAERYSGVDTVIGADLHNEPHGPATWGTGDQATDWRLAAERAGNAILEVNPDLLIIVQGVEKVQDDWYWWGGNLSGARDNPVSLSLPGRLVYSTHVYGPGVYPQPWFSDPDFPENMPEIWDRHWGYLQKGAIAPVIVGEFGGRSVGSDAEGIWQRALVSYLRENNISYIYWTLNPNSGDTGGILLDDWQTVDPGKEDLLSGYQFPLIGIEQIGPEPSSRLASPTPPVSTATQAASPIPQITTGLQVRYRNANPAENSQDSKPEFILKNNSSIPLSLDNLELSYYFTDEGNQPFVFHCDWAAMGCANVIGEFQPGEGDTRILNIQFRPGLEPLPPGQESGEIKVRFNRQDWSEFHQSDDYSFTPAGDYLEWERVTLAVNGQVIWGIMPGGTAAEAQATLQPPSATLPPLPVTPSPDASTAAAAPEQEPQETPLPTIPASPDKDLKASNPPWQAWIAPALATLAAFALGFLIAAFWLGRRYR